MIDDMLTKLFFALFLTSCALTGCVNSPFSPTMSANLSLYNRGGTLDSGASEQGSTGSDVSEINTEGGGEVSTEIDPEAVALP